jgi:FAD/FMN-containing dehydrogenase
VPQLKYLGINTNMPTPNWTTLRNGISGSIILPGESGYTGYTLGWNARVGLAKFPAAVALPINENDISTIVKFGYDNGITLAPRSGGHSFVGNSNTDGILLDLRGYTGITITDNGNRVTIKSGTLIGNVYYDLYNYSGKTLTIPTVDSGNSFLGIGLALGGGHGTRSTQSGVLSQRLRAARVVLYDGSIVECNNYKNSDLLWALKGGGGIFGIVTEYTLEPQNYYSLQTATARYNMPGVTATIKSWQNFSVIGGNTLEASCVISWPNAPFVKNYADGGTGLFVDISLRGQGTTTEIKNIIETCGILPEGFSYSTLTYSTSSVPSTPPFSTAQERTYNFGLMPKATFTDAALDVIMRKTREFCLGICGSGTYSGLSGSYDRPPSIIMHRYGGVVSGDNTNSNSFPHMKAVNSGQFRMDWNATDTRHETYAKFMTDFFIEMGNFCGYTGIGYVNYPLGGLTVGGMTGYANVYWGDNLYKLQQVKKAYDPNNFFNVPHTLPPLN